MWRDERTRGGRRYEMSWTVSSRCYWILENTFHSHLYKDTQVQVPPFS